MFKLDSLHPLQKIQRRKWINIKKRAVDRFAEVVGDLDINMIERQHALKFWRYWQVRIAPKQGRARLRRQGA